MTTLKTVRSILLAAISILLSIAIRPQAYGQCFFTPPEPAPCSGGNGALQDNTNVNSGQTYYYAGSGTLDNISLNGGTIRVCGTLTLSNSFNFNSGRIIIEESGSLTISNSYNLNGNCSIINRGLLTLRGTIVMQNSNNYIMNVGSSAMLMMPNSGTRLELNSSSAYFSNEGIADIYELYIQGQAAAGSVCLGLSSCTQTGYVTNNRAGSVTASGQKAALSVAGNIYLNQPLTTDTALVICMRTGSTKSGPATYGTPKIYTDCPSCSYALPVVLSAFSARTQGRDVQVSWTTASESNNAYFTVERSSDALEWEEIATLSGQGNSNQLTDYDYTDIAVPAGTWYYRLRQTDYNGQSETFAPASVLVQESSGHFSAYPVPFSDQLNVLFSTDEGIHTLEILNGLGQVVQTVQVSGPSAQISTSTLIPGFYFIRYGSETLKVLKKG